MTDLTSCVFTRYLGDFVNENGDKFGTVVLFGFIQTVKYTEMNEDVEPFKCTSTLASL